MTTNVVDLGAYRDRGNGAREALIRYFEEWPSQELELGRVDHLLAWLWKEGFRIVPLGEEE